MQEKEKKNDNGLISLSTLVKLPNVFLKNLKHIDNFHFRFGYVKVPWYF